MRRLLDRCIPPEWRDSIQGDLDEIFSARVRAGMPRWRARIAYLLDAAGVAIRFAAERRPRRLPRRREGFMGALGQDLVYGVRALGKAPGFAAVAIVTLALGIGANIVLFAVIDTLLIRPLPFVDADRLMMLWGDHARISKQFGLAELPANTPTYLAWRDENDVFDDLAAMRVNFFNTMFDGEPHRMVSVDVTPSLFDLLGVQPLHGRLFRRDEEELGRHRVVLMGFDLWRTRFGGSEDVVGQTLEMNGERYEIVGVMPHGFRFPENKYLPAPYQFPVKTELWTPLAFDERERERGRAWNLTVLGRLKHGVSRLSAEEAMNAVAQSLEESREENAGWRVRLEPLRGQMVGKLEPALLLLSGTVAVVLLIACANIANLLLTRASARESEIALRAALGGTRVRILRQLLTESVLLGVAGGVSACGVLAVNRSLWFALVPASLPFAEEIGLDARVLVFAFVLSLGTSLVFGLFSAARVLRKPLWEALRERGRSGAARMGWVENGLVVAEVALCLVLLVGAGLLVRSFRELMDIDPGFRAGQLLTMEIQRPAEDYDAEAGTQFFSQLLEEIESLPGVAAAAAGTNVPFAGAESGSEVILTAHPDPGSGQRPHVRYYSVSASFFPTLQIPLIQGRLLSPSDRRDGPQVAVVSESFARRILPGEDPVGQSFRFAFSDDDELYEIVGVVGDVRMASLERDPQPITYIPHQQMASPYMFLAVRSDGHVEGLSTAVREKVWELDPKQPIAGVVTMADRMSASVTARRYVLSLLAAFAAVALVLATVGVYGVVSYSVVRRTREMGVRMALGAERLDIVKLVLARGLVLASVGTALGLAGAFALSRLLSSFLFEVSPLDPTTFVAVPLVLLLTTALASYVPARRATGIDPVVTLRYE